MSLSFIPEGQLDFLNNDGQFRMKLFFRADQGDKKREHFDIRELYYYNRYSNFDFLMGNQVVFWGVTESVHLVDIINQTDFLEHPIEERKLGQTMLKVGYYSNYGYFQLFFLPLFKERIFQGETGRFSLNNVVDFNNTTIEDRGGVDIALKWERTISLLDIGLSYFSGRSRDPLFIISNASRLTPFYEKIEQFGLEGQLVLGAFSFKSEIIKRSANENQLNKFTSYVLGGEYLLDNTFSSGVDTYMLLEYINDSRNELATDFRNNELFFGFKILFNDVKSSSLLIGGFVDVEAWSKLYKFEFKRRIDQSLEFKIEGSIFANFSEQDPLFLFRKDSFIQMTFGWFID